MNNQPSILQQAFATLRPAAPLTNGDLTLLPFTTTYRSRARYVLLPKAIERRRLTVTEVSEGGSVPYLRAINKGPCPVLIFDGEELSGAKQNRIVNVTILVGVGEAILPVSCVEQGRWNRRSRAFAAGSYASHPSLRKEKELHVRGSLARTERGRHAQDLPQVERAAFFQADQRAVWDEVETRSHALGVSSDTGAMADAYVERGRDLDAAVSPFLRPLDAVGVDDGAESGATERVPVEGMVAVAVFRGAEFVCLDALWPAKRFAEIYPKLLRGYVLEALGQASAPASPAGDPEAEMLRLFADLAHAGIDEHPGVDLGRDIRVQAKAALAAGLVWDGSLVQLSVFPS